MSPTKHVEDVEIPESFSALDQKEESLKINQLSVSVLGSDQIVVDPIEERKTLWKIDLWLLPMGIFLYFFSAMDRADIGNAQVAGMQTAIKATDSQWATIVALFNLGYVVTQPIGTLSIRKLTPPVLAGSAAVLWGLLTVCTMQVTTYAQAVTIRVLVGAAEGLIQSQTVFMAMWYTPTELATRIAIFFSVYSLAGSVNGLIAYGVVKDFQDRPPFEPFQWLFLIEGVLSIAYGIIVFFLLPQVPEKVKFGFTEKEKEIIVLRSLRGNNTPHATLKWKQIFLVFLDPLIWLLAVAYATNHVSMTTITSFLPTILQGMGYNSLHSQLMTVPVYAVCLVTTICFGYLADKWQRRGYLIIGLSAVSIVAYILLIAVTNNKVRYFAVFLAAGSQFPCIAIILSWSLINVLGYARRSTVSAFINMVSYAVAIGAAKAFDTPPYYVKGSAVVLAMMILLMLSSIGLVFYCKKENRRKLREKDSVEADELRQKSIEEIGNSHPDFMYVI